MIWEVWQVLKRCVSFMERCDGHGGGVKEFGEVYV